MGERESRVGKVLAKRKIKQIDGRLAFKVPVNGAEETRKEGRVSRLQWRAGRYRWIGR